MDTLEGPTEEMLVVIEEKESTSDEVELPVALSSCNCGDFRCFGLYVKTHLIQSECLFSYYNKGIDAFLPSLSEYKSTFVDRFIKDAIGYKKLPPKSSKMRQGTLSLAERYLLTQK